MYLSDNNYIKVHNRIIKWKLTNPFFSPHILKLTHTHTEDKYLKIHLLINIRLSFAKPFYGILFDFYGLGRKRQSQQYLGCDETISVNVAEKNLILSSLDKS